LWLVSGSAATARAAEQDLGEAVRHQQQSNWIEARSAIDRAAVRLAGGGPDSVRRRLDSVRRASEFAATLDAMRQKVSRDADG